jgi:hypothetical protein
MQTLRLLSVLRLSLSLVLLPIFLAACAAETPTVSPIQPEAASPSVTEPSSLPATEVLSQPTSFPTEALAATEVPVATSRGPDLHATDPTTVRLDSGGLQLVEFFRFT